METLSIDVDIPETIQFLSKILDGNLYIVGGFVRDKLFSHFHNFEFNPKDLDVATSFHPEEILKRAKDHNLKTLEIGKSFGVVVILFPDGTECEVATFRNEWYDPESGDGRRPDIVEFSTPEIDAQRRDLTINGLFYNIERKQVIDYVGGISDIKNQIIRPIGSANQRYKEDRLRVLRTIRFLCRYKSVENAREDLDNSTLESIEKWKSLPGVSGERIATEFKAGLSQAINPEQYLTSLSILDLFPSMFPGLIHIPEFAMDTDSRNIKVVLARIFEFRSDLQKQLINLKYDKETAHTASFLASLFRFVPENICSYLKARDRFEIDMTEDVTELCRCTSLELKEVEKIMNFRSSVSASDFPNLFGPELGKAIKDETTKLFIESFL